MASRILITGGSGRLGQALRAIAPEALAPSRQEFDILDLEQCWRYVEEHDPALIIHCAAFADSAMAEVEREQCWNVNVQGTRNVFSVSQGRRLVYISTDYVFDGEDGDYNEDSIPRPINFYGLTKLVGEQMVLDYPDVLVLRAPFRADPPWAFKRAFADQWTSCDFVSLRAMDVLQAAQMKLDGILHIGGDRRSILEMAQSVSPNVRPMKRSDVSVPLPRDTSLNSERWQALKASMACASVQ